MEYIIKIKIIIYFLLIINKKTIKIINTKRGSKAQPAKLPVSRGPEAIEFACPSLVSIIVAITSLVLKILT